MMDELLDAHDPLGGTIKNILLSILFTFLLLMSGFLLPLTPLPFFYIARRYPLGIAIFTWSLFILLLATLYAVVLIHFHSLLLDPEKLRWFSWLPGMLYLEMFGAKTVAAVGITMGIVLSSLGFFLGRQTRSEKQIFSLILRVVLFEIVITFGMVLLSTSGHPEKFISGISQYLHTSFDQVLETYKARGMSAEDIASLDEKKGFIFEMILRHLPSLFVAPYFMIVGLNLFLARRLFGRLGFFNQVQDFSLMKIPFVMVWVFIVGGIFYWLNLYHFHSDRLDVVLVNLFVVMSVLYFFQGMSIFSFYLKVKNVPPFMRAVSYFFIIFISQLIGFLLLGALGFFDSWINLRKLGKQTKL